jgi:hypothetical protein
MNNTQATLAELLKLKAFMLEQISLHHLVVHPADVLDKINQAIDAVEKLNS